MTPTTVDKTWVRTDSTGGSGGEITAYRKQDEGRRFRSSWTPRFHPFRGHQCQHG